LKKVRIANIRPLAATIGKTNADGFAIVEEELELGLRLIALPINDRISWMLSQLTLASFSATEQD
jgi:IclR family transcriptional regulator, pca regulon regulatory protein